MKKYVNPSREFWSELTKRPVFEFSELFPLVEQVFQNIKIKGDKALFDYTEKFDKVKLKNFKVSDDEIQLAETFISDELKLAIQNAYNNIYKFHNSQKELSNLIETSKGVFCWRENRPVGKVGVYIPGGTAPLFSTVLMLGIPAQIAGCKEIILCTPPDIAGKVNPAILYVANLVGVTSVFKLGGIQAIGAMAIGSGSIPKVDKIFGPGNQYVMAAKQLAQNYGIAIDIPAGPSEVLVIADETSYPEFVAADLLSQAEHGADSQVILASDSEKVLNDVLEEMRIQTELLPRNEIIKEALKNSKAILFETIDDCIEFSNQYASEHLILNIENPQNKVQFVQNAGSVFLGNYSCESAGDYASGTNHTLPTNGLAKAYSGVSLDSFVKKITFQEINRQGIQEIGKTIELMAEAEGLQAHKNAVTIRLEQINQLKTEINNEKF